MKYEIRLMYAGEGGEDSTTSGTLDMPESEALALFAEDCASLSAGETAELSNADTGEVLKVVRG